MGQERRRQPRVRTRDVAAHLVKEDKSTLSSIENLSSGGAFIRTAEVLPVGSLLQMTVVRPGMKRAIQLVGRVTAVVGADEAAGKHAMPGMGVRFEPMAPEVRGRLDGLLKELGLRETHPEGLQSSVRPVPPAGAPRGFPAPARPPASSPVARPPEATAAQATAAPAAHGESDEAAALRRLLALRDAEIELLRQKVKAAESAAERHRQILEVERLAHDAKVEKLVIELGHLKRTRA